MTAKPDIGVTGDIAKPVIATIGSRLAGAPAVFRGDGFDQLAAALKVSLRKYACLSVVPTSVA